MKPATQPVTPMKTLVDCGCETKVHKDGSGVEVYMCPLHESAPELLEALQDVTERLALSLQVFGNSPEVVNVNVANARAAIAKATEQKGRYE